MITGSFTDNGGGVHAAAVGKLTSLNADLIRKVLTVQLSIYHDLAGQTAKNPRSVTVKKYTIAGDSFTVDEQAVYSWLIANNYPTWTLLSA